MHRYTRKFLRVVGALPHPGPKMNEIFPEGCQHHWDGEGEPPLHSVELHEVVRETNALINDVCLKCSKRCEDRQEPFFVGDMFNAYFPEGCSYRWDGDGDPSGVSQVIFLTSVSAGDSIERCCAGCRHDDCEARKAGYGC